MFALDVAIAQAKDFPAAGQIWTARAVAPGGADSALTAQPNARIMAPEPQTRQRVLPRAVFVGCTETFCELVQGPLTVRLPRNAELPEAFASFLASLAPHSAVSAVVLLPVRSGDADPRLVAIRLRDTHLPERVWSIVDGL